MRATTTAATAALVQAAPPTARTIRWYPLAGLAVLLVLVASASRSSAMPADTVLALAAAGLAGAVVATLHDPAASLLAPMPVSVMRRRVLRLLLVTVPVLATWLLLGWMTTTSPEASGVGPLLALTATGVAVAVWARPDRAVLLGACLPVVWFVLDRSVPVDGLAQDVLGWWRTDPWPVVLVGVVSCVAGRRR